MGLDADALDRHQNESPKFLVQVITLVSTTTLGSITFLIFKSFKNITRHCFVP
jgi:hypothetical protein